MKLQDGLDCVAMIDAAFPELEAARGYPTAMDQISRTDRGGFCQSRADGNAGRVSTVRSIDRGGVGANRRAPSRNFRDTAALGRRGLGPGAGGHQARRFLCLSAGICPRGFCAPSMPSGGESFAPARIRSRTARTFFASSRPYRRVKTKDQVARLVGNDLGFALPATSAPARVEAPARRAIPAPTASSDTAAASAKPLAADLQEVLDRMRKRAGKRAAA